MKIGVLGTGMVGSAVGGKLAKLGHDVMLGSRDPGGARLRQLANSLGASVGGHAEAAAHGDWVINAMPGEPSIDILRGCAIDGKIMVDIANYDHAVDQPIAVPLGEAIQRAFPRSGS
jgi:predicted dinucleotide-binding enzyme